MRGSIQTRRTTSWRVCAYIGRDAVGKPQYVQKTVSGSRREAERELARVLTDVEDGRYSPSATMSLNHLLERSLDVKAISIEPSTLESYRRIASHYVRPALGDRKVGKLRPIDLDMLYADLSARGLSPRTVRICHSILRQSLEQARRWGLIARSPAVDSTPIPQRRKEVIPPTVQEVARILDAAMAAARRRRFSLAHHCRPAGAG